MARRTAGTLWGPRPFAFLVLSLLYGSGYSRDVIRARCADPSERDRHISTQTSELSHAFRKFQLPSNLERAILRAGYREPRPIQTRAIPAALRGQDLSLIHI